MLVDLHMHTYYSDGSLSPTELVRVAKEKGLGMISITDHNALDSYEEAAAACSEAGIRLIKGVELDCLYADRTVHVLAYDFEPTKEFMAMVNKSRFELDHIGDKLIAKMEKDYDIVSVADYEQYKHDRTKGGWKGIHYLHDLKLTTTLLDGMRFYKEYGCTHATCDFPTVEEACRLIHKSGGVAVLAHPGKYYGNSPISELEDALEDLRLKGIDGVECYYPIHSEALTKTCVDFCNTHDLMVTVGCDCHGEFLKKNPNSYNMGCVSKNASELRLRF
ncbi:MAG TPA: PHP domain-containing protein [Firmicutes bacterium]|nr:PHP domain-containing protein [Bacillota bacterium]